jgi:hypothetical protein
MIINDDEAGMEMIDFAIYLIPNISLEIYFILVNY